MCQAIAKYLLFGFNFIFWLAGAACLGVGIWLNVDEDVANSIEVSGVNVFYAGAWILIVAGAIMLVVGFFGCCGAIKESKCLLGLYFGCLFVLFGLQVGIGIFCIVEFDSFEEVITETLDQIVLESEENVLVATAQNLQCCGKTKGCEDWVESNLPSYGCGCDPAAVDNATYYCVPIANTASCQRDPLFEPDVGIPRNYVYGQPCSEALADFVGDNFIIVGAVALAIGLAEIVGMIIAMSLCCSIKD